MNKNGIFLVVVLVALLSVSPLTYAATTWSAQQYDLFVGDFNGDSRDDILYIAKNSAYSSGIVLSDAPVGPKTPLQARPSNSFGSTWGPTLYMFCAARSSCSGP